MGNGELDELKQKWDGVKTAIAMMMVAVVGIVWIWTQDPSGQVFYVLIATISGLAGYGLRSAQQDIKRNGRER